MQTSSGLAEDWQDREELTWNLRVLKAYRMADGQNKMKLLLWLHVHRLHRIYRRLCNAGEWDMRSADEVSMFLAVCNQVCALPRVPPRKDIQVSTVLNLKHAAYVFLSTSCRAIAETIHIGQSTTSSGKAPTSDSRPGVLTDLDSWCLPSLAPQGGVWNVPSPFGSTARTA